MLNDNLTKCSTLTLQELDNFCANFNCYLDTFTPINNQKFILKMISETFSNNPEFIVDDLSCLGINEVEGLDLSALWTNFVNESYRMKTYSLNHNDTINHTL